MNKLIELEIDNSSDDYHAEVQAAVLRFCDAWDALQEKSPDVQTRYQAACAAVAELRALVDPAMVDELQ